MLWEVFYVVCESDVFLCLVMYCLMCVVVILVDDL